MIKKINWSLYGAVLSVNLISLIGGGAYSWTSPVLPKLTGTKDPDGNPLGRLITPFEQSWIVSLISLGACIGPFLGGALVDRIGRKKTLLLLSIPMIISHVVLAFASDINLYYFSRFFLGLGVGCVYSVVPMYVGEIAEDSNRGTLGCIMNASCTVGSLFCFTVGPFVSIKLFSLLFVAPPVAFLVIFGFFVPESPYYLLMVNKEEKAKAALMGLRRGLIHKELEEIKMNVENSKLAQAKFVDLFKSRATTRGLLIGSGLMLLQQLSGISIVASYMQSIFDAAGAGLTPETSSVVIGVVQVLINLVTSQLVDRLGRRILLLISLAGMCLSHTFLGLYFFLKMHDFDAVSYLSWLPVGTLVLYVVMFNIGIGPVSWAMTGELFPQNFKSIATTWTSFVCLFSSFVLMVFFPNLSVMIGMAYSFWIFAGSCGVGIIFVWKVVPETKGKSLREIQDALDSNTKM